MTAPRFLHRLLCALGLHECVFFRQDKGDPRVHWMKCKHCGHFKPEVIP